jgi:hypothetical protein
MWMRISGSFWMGVSLFCGWLSGLSMTFKFEEKEEIRRRARPVVRGSELLANFFSLLHRNTECGSRDIMATQLELTSRDITRVKPQYGQIELLATVPLSGADSRAGKQP